MCPQFLIISPCTFPLYVLFRHGRPPSDWIALHRLSSFLFVCLFRSLPPDPFRSFPRYPHTHPHIRLPHSREFSSLFVYLLGVFCLLPGGGFPPSRFPSLFFAFTGNQFVLFDMEKCMRMATHSAHGGPNAYLTTRLDRPYKINRKRMLAFRLQNTNGKRKCDQLRTRNLEAWSKRRS